MLALKNIESQFCIFSLSEIWSFVPAINEKQEKKGRKGCHHYTTKSNGIEFVRPFLYTMPRWILAQIISWFNVFWQNIVHKIDSLSQVLNFYHYEEPLSVTFNLPKKYGSIQIIFGLFFVWNSIVIQVVIIIVVIHTVIILKHSKFTYFTTFITFQYFDGNWNSL